MHTQKLITALLGAVSVALSGVQFTARANYTGSLSVVPENNYIQTAGTEILGAGGGTGSFIYKGGGNAVDAAVAGALSACIVIPASCSLGGYGGHMMIWKSGADGDQKLVTCIDFNTAAGSLASGDMFASSVNPTNGHWTGATPAANLTGWKATGVPGTFGGLYMAQTNYGRKVSGTNYYSFAEIMRPTLAQVANKQATIPSYYTLTSVSNLLMDLYTNADPYAVFYSGDIAHDIATAMQANGGLVTYADMTNYHPREVVPYIRHFNCPGGTPANVCIAPMGSAGLAVMQELVMLESIGWSNGPAHNWNSLQSWHARAEIARLTVKDHYQWLGDPWAGVTPPDFLGNGSTNFMEQFLAHATRGYSVHCPWDLAEVQLTNSLADLITTAVNNRTNTTISVDWDDIRYGTCNISTCDQWGNCVAVTLSMGGGYGAQVAVTNRALVMGQGMALFDARPGWPNSIAPGKRPVDNMSPAIVIPDNSAGILGGRPPFAVGAAGGSTIENNMASILAKYLMDGPSEPQIDPDYWLYNFEANKAIYMLPGYPAGVAAYLTSAGFTAPGLPPSSGSISHVEAWIPPVILSQPVGSNIVAGSSITFSVNATGLPIFYQWCRNGEPLRDSTEVVGSHTSQLTLSNVGVGGVYTVVGSNGAGSLTSTAANLVVGGAPVLVASPVSVTNVAGSTAVFSVSSLGSSLVYRWKKNGALIFQAASSSLTIANISASDVASYVAIVTNNYGSVVTPPGVLTIGQTNIVSPLFLFEPFDYSNVGSPVSSNTPANWTYGGTGANDLTVAPGNLSYPGLAAPVGNSVTNGGTGLGVRRLFGTNFSSGKIYFSALLRVNDLGYGSWNGQFSSLGALCATDNTSFRVQVLVQSNSPNGYIIGTEKSGTGVTASFDATEHVAGETIFLVGKYDFTVSPNVVKLWINPSSANFGATNEPATDFISATSGTDGFVIDRFNMRQNTSSGSFSVPANVQWDELRFGFSWGDVTPPAGPVSPPVIVELTRPVRAADGSCQFIYNNSVSSPLSVFASSDLVNWYSLGTATQLSAGVFQFTDPAAKTLAKRFYQLRAP